MIEIHLPSRGDDDDAVTGGKVSELLAAVGDHLEVGDDLLELITDKAAFVVPSPAAGTVAQWRVAEGDAVKVGDVLCTLNPGA